MPFTAAPHPHPRPRRLRALLTAGALMALAPALVLPGCARNRRADDRAMSEQPSEVQPEGAEAMIALDEGDEHYLEADAEPTARRGRRGLRLNGPFARHTRSRRPDYSIPISGPAVTGEQQVAVDVQNTAGVVRVIVDERLEQAEVRIRPIWTGVGRKERPEWDVIDATDWGVAEHVQQDPERSILRVSGNERALGGEYPIPALEIVIRTPAADGLLVRSGAGEVDVLNVRGAITIENGVSGGAGGPVRVRTNHPIDAPVNIVTTGGDILLVAAGESRGTVRLHAPDGRTVFHIPSGRVADVRDGGRDGYTAVWNGGTNEIVLHSMTDDVRLIETRLPSMYTHSEFDPTTWGNTTRDLGLPF